MFQPFGSSSLAQNIIDSRLSGVNASTPMERQDINQFGVFRNPYSPEGFYANETDQFPRPAFTPPTVDEEGNPQCNNEEGYFYDPITNSCKLIEPEPTSDGNGDNKTPQPVYQGVGSVFSPVQNAFMNLGLGGSTADDVKSYFGSGEIDPYGSGLSGFFRRFTPMGQFSTFRDVNTLVNAGVLDRASDGTLRFAKGGNLAYALANQKFEQDLAKKQGLNLDAKADTPYAVDSSGNPIYMTQSRGDKADDFGKINLDGRSSRPFQSNYGASQIVSYSPPDPNRQKSASERMFEAKRTFTSPKKQINSQAFTGMGYTRGR